MKFEGRKAEKGEGEGDKLWGDRDALTYLTTPAVTFILGQLGLSNFELRWHGLISVLGTWFCQ